MTDTFVVKYEDETYSITVDEVEGVTLEDNGFRLRIPTPVFKQLSNFALKTEERIDLYRDIADYFANNKKEKNERL